MRTQSSRPLTRRLLVTCVLLGALTALACGSSIGAGFLIRYPAPWRGPWGDAPFVGGPVFR